MSLCNLFNQRMAVQQQSVTQTETGAVVRTWQEIATNVPCRLQPLRNRRYRQASETDDSTTHRLFFEPAVTMTRGDRVVIGNRQFLVLTLDRVCEAGRPEVAMLHENSTG